MQSLGPIDSALLKRVIELAQHLDKPISFLDLETTSPWISSPSFGVTEVGVYVVRPDGRQVNFSQLINPGFPIPPKVTEITGINDDMVYAAPEFPFLKQRLDYLLEKSLVVGFNIRPYDLPGIYTQYRRYGLGLPAPGAFLDIRDVWVEIQKTQKGKLTEVAEHYGKAFSGAHRAMSDVLGCVHLLEGMIEAHGQEALQKQIKAFPSLVAPEMPSHASQEEWEKQEKLAFAKEKAKDVILQFIAEGGEWDLPFIVGRGGLQDEFVASLAVQDLLDQGHIRPEQIQVPVVKLWLTQYWPQLKGVCVSGKLKPIMTKARALGAPPEFDYTQLRAALKQDALMQEEESLKIPPLVTLARGGSIRRSRHG